MSSNPEVAIESVWEALLTCADSERVSVSGKADAIGIDRDGRIGFSRDERVKSILIRAEKGTWQPAEALRGEARVVAELYAPICRSSKNDRLTVGHLGQSLDGHIATKTGDSYYITGPQNILHLHRMRALCSAVIVGAGTVAADDPSLTVRHVTGSNPARIVLDPSGRLSRSYKVFTDGEAPTWLVCGPKARNDDRFGQARVLEVPVVSGELDLREMIERLADYGLTTLFVEGGGKTVSRFLDAGLLDRLQVAVARLITGAGRLGLDTAARENLVGSLRPAGRVFRMGEDILFDCDLRKRPEDSTPSPAQGLDRIY